MKKATIFILLVFISSLLSAQWVVDNGFGFKINVPSDWTRETKTEGTDKIYDFVHPSNNIFLEVRAFKADASVTPDAIAQYFESQYLPSANRVAFEDYTLNNTPGKFAGYTMTVNGLEVGIGTFYAVKNGFGYVLWTMIETRLYNQYSGIGDEVLNTFTTISASSTSKRVVIPPSFKITNMKLGKSLTSNYDILPQQEAEEFQSNQDKIYVIWDWEGKAVGKTMTVKWYYNGQEITGASKSYTLPADAQGYGYANIIKPSGGFKVGRYFVQIDFQGQKQRRIDFEIKKPASNAEAGFVIVPPGSKGNSSNNGNSNGKNINPNSSNSNFSSNFSLNHQSFKLGEELQPGSKSNLKSSSTKFYKNTPQVISVFKWNGNGNGHQIKVNWHYYAPGSSDKMTIVSSTFDFPNQEGGESNFSLSKPDAGWPEGQYWVEYYMDGQYENEFRFDVVPGSSSAGSSSTSAWGTATGGSSASQNSSAKKIVLTSAGSESCYSFKTGKIHGDHQNADIMVEPWCTEDVGVCGNWLVTNYTNMDAVTTAPSTGYLSDGKSFTDCDVMDMNKVVIIKLKDGTYAKMMILKTDFTKSNSQNPPCQHKATILVQYPAF
ncbi:hypothetical protein HNS38_15915 [Lentimicrobium sp. L6]|uniref:hypothetical protein n=1 Tax=Lentimicrobium sp. L6 TaxID=2735916 RepID=UPI00155824D0|nr:hypothetical protein [Lentimicrobium sp. L6]NPD86260.1 hypothetical protein [Lentimicrobium sp. L6]